MGLEELEGDSAEGEQAGELRGAEVATEEVGLLVVERREETQGLVELRGGEGQEVDFLPVAGEADGIMATCWR